jgi:putative ABC transport system ATP-binding protein
MIELVGINKVYRMGDNIVNALININLKIEMHEFLAIIGPSGSGKSTLMNMLGCLDTPTTGKYIQGLMILLPACSGEKST